MDSYEEKKFVRHSKLDSLIQEQKVQSFLPEYQSKISPEEALGVLIAQYFEWDGLAILQTLYAALEESNYHTENKTVELLINKLEGGYKHVAQ